MLLKSGPYDLWIEGSMTPADELERLYHVIYRGARHPFSSSCSPQLTSKAMGQYSKIANR